MADSCMAAVSLKVGNVIFKKHPAGLGRKEKDSTVSSEPKLQRGTCVCREGLFVLEIFAK